MYPVCLVEMSALHFGVLPTLPDDILRIIAHEHVSKQFSNEGCTRNMLETCFINKTYSQACEKRGVFKECKKTNRIKAVRDELDACFKKYAADYDNNNQRLMALEFECIPLHISVAIRSPNNQSVVTVKSPYERVYVTYDDAFERLSRFIMENHDNVWRCMFFAPYNPGGPNNYVKPPEWQQDVSKINALMERYVAICKG